MLLIVQKSAAGGRTEGGREGWEEEVGVFCWAPPCPVKKGEVSLLRMEDETDAAAFED